MTLFGGAQFHSKLTSFGEAQFPAGSIVDFSKPTAWKNMKFDWDNDVARKPGNVLPQDWPPQIEDADTD